MIDSDEIVVLRSALRRMFSPTDAGGPLVPAGLRDATIEVLAGGLFYWDRRIRDTFVTYRELANRPDVRTWWFDSRREYEFTEPAYYNRLPAEIESLIGRHECCRPFVLEVPDVVLKTSDGLAVTDDGRYVVFNFWVDPDDLARSRYAARSLSYDLVHAAKNGSLWAGDDDGIEVDLAVPLLSIHATNYTHWTQEALTLLEGVEEYRSRTGKDPTLVIPPDPPSFVTESLAAFGYTEDDYLEWDHGRIRVDRLVLPSDRRCLKDTPSDEFFRMISAFDWVRDRAREGVSTGGSDGHAPRILICREDAGTRRITNREEVEEALSEQGFESYVLGELSYGEQVRLFSGAEFVVGAHGAGMINSIYATDAGVLELYGDHFLPANYELAQGLGNRYGCLQCEAVGDDLYVHVDELVAAVDTIVGR